MSEPAEATTAPEEAFALARRGLPLPGAALSLPKGAWLPAALRSRALPERARPLEWRDLAEEMPVAETDEAAIEPSSRPAPPRGAPEAAPDVIAPAAERPPSLESPRVGGADPAAATMPKEPGSRLPIGEPRPREAAAAVATPAALRSVAVAAAEHPAPPRSLGSAEPLREGVDAGRPAAQAPESMQPGAGEPVGDGFERPPALAPAAREPMGPPPGPQHASPLPGRADAPHRTAAPPPRASAVTLSAPGAVRHVLMGAAGAAEARSPAPDLSPLLAPPPTPARTVRIERLHVALQTTPPPPLAAPAPPAAPCPSPPPAAPGFRNPWSTYFARRD